MFKPPSLRAHLARAVPELTRDPDKLSILVRNGRIVCTGAPSLSFEYVFTLQLVVLDYAGQADAIMVPLLAWLQQHQSEIFDNPDKRDKSVRFEVEYLNSETVDLSIELDLTERVIVRARTGEPPGVFDIAHAAEPPRVGVITQAERWEFWMKDEMLAAWDYDPR
jgi:P2 phage tail completion protein R (GpR)